MPEHPTPSGPASPGPGARRRSGPRPGNTESRKKILGSAGVAFAANGYAGTSLRGVAREAGVDPSLIVHFFGSKAGLFAAVVSATFDPGQMTSEMAVVDPAEIGTFIATRFLMNWEQGEGRSPLLSFMSAALADPTAAELLREFIMTNLALPVIARAGTDQPELRAALLSSQVMGLGLARYGLAFDALADAPTPQLMAWLADAVQRTCTGALPRISN